MLKAASEKPQATNKGNPICLRADLSVETLQARRQWQDILNLLKGKNLQPRLLHLARISFKIDGEIKSFSDKQKLREFSTTRKASPNLRHRQARAQNKGLNRDSRLQTFKVVSDDDPTLVISQFGNSLLEIIVIGEALQRGIFDGENLTLKLGSIQGDMAAGFLVVVVVLLAIHVITASIFIIQILT